jgi:hypothetical protein
MPVQNRLAHLLREAASGRFPSADGSISVMAGVNGVAAAVVAFTNHNIIATDLSASEVIAHLPSNDPGAAMNPGFLAWLGERLDAWPYAPDIVLAASPGEPDPLFSLIERNDLEDHPRVQLAKRYRREVRVYSDKEDRGLVTFGRGLAGRREVSIEVKPQDRSLGLGRMLALAVRSLVAGTDFASVSPGNAASLRAFLAAGFQPICSEVVLLEKRRVDVSASVRR